VDGPHEEVATVRQEHDVGGDEGSGFGQRGQPHALAELARAWIDQVD
jgi:hypothetical protein